MYTQRNRGQNAWSTPRNSQRSEQLSVRETELPVSNMNNVLQDESGDLNDIRRMTGGENKGVSPLERDVIFKRQREHNDETNETIIEEIVPMDTQIIDDNDQVPITGPKTQSFSHSGHQQTVQWADVQTSDTEQTVKSKNENHSASATAINLTLHKESYSTDTQNTRCSQELAGTSTIEIPKYVNSAQLYYGPTIRSPETSKNTSQNENINQTNDNGSSVLDPTINHQSS